MRSRGLAVPPPPPGRASAPAPAPAAMTGRLPSSGAAIPPAPPSVPPPPPKRASSMPPPPPIEPPTAPEIALPPAAVSGPHPAASLTGQATLITGDVLPAPGPLPAGKKLLEPGDTVAGWELVRRVKAGGMGSLWVGRRTGVGGFAKHVAIKVIHPHLGENQDFVRMFLDEARLTARIAHPHVIQVFDVGLEHGSYFMVMELVAGCSLSDLSTYLASRNARLRPELAAAIVRDIALGLHAAHELRGEQGQFLGLVHRDVSPDNILLGVQGGVKLIDFGIAKATERLHETRQPTLKGKLRYLAPEQLGGHLDRRTDVFALGIVLWELLTGQRIYDGASDPELLDRVRDPRVVAPTFLAPELGPAVDALMARMTAVEPEARPATMAEVADLLLAAIPKTREVGAAQIASLASAITATGVGVVDGVDPATFAPDLGALVLDRLAPSAVTTGRILLPQPRSKEATRNAWLVGGGIVALAALLGVAVLVHTQNSVGTEMRAQSLAPTATHTLVTTGPREPAAPSSAASPAPPAPWPATAATPSTPLPSTPVTVASLPAGPVERTEAAPVTTPAIAPAVAPTAAPPPATAARARPAARPRPHPARPRSAAGPRGRAGRASVVDGTPLSTEL
ncbi:MAG: serine/threonine-protein kinase [Sandaracinus sp.]